jgi:choline monooxygenase
MNADPQSNFASSDKIVDADIKRAGTLPTSFYQDPALWKASLDKIWLRSWQIAAFDHELQGLNVWPFSFLDKVIAEPLLLSKADDWKCMSNVCTHRAKILVEAAGKKPQLRCRYHGRCFDLNGQMLSMPEFEDAHDFPRDCEHLPQLPLEHWMQMYFTSVEPFAPWEEVFKPIKERMAFYPAQDLQPAPALDRDYPVKAHWALYCDNYLEGFHIPYVHHGLNKVIDYGSYSTEIYPYCNLQLGLAKEGEMHFPVREDGPDAGLAVAAYYWWIFPNLMLNFYPWGISINIVDPIDAKHCLVRFRTLVCDESKIEGWYDLDTVEAEDEAVVESVQLGVNSRLYAGGRFSPKMEKGVHHFHYLLQQFLLQS